MKTSRKTIPAPSQNDTALHLLAARSTAESLAKAVESHTADLCAALELLAGALPADSNTQRMARICRDMVIDHEGVHESLVGTLAADLAAASTQAEVAHG